MLFQYVNVEALVPKNHLLRKVDAVLDLSFVREAVTACYSATRVRRTLVDFAGKIVRTSGYIILRVTRACLHQLKLEELWRRSGDPPRFAWSR